jgi:hypothetical protein
MGTRHLVVVRLNNEVKVAQYGQFDGYMSGAGRTIQRILSFADLNLLKELVAKCWWITDDEHNKMMADLGVKSNDGWISLDDSKKIEKAYPHLHRNCSAEVITEILNSENGLPLQNSYDFGEDGLFCEYTYTVDLDNDTLTAQSGGLDGKVLFQGPINTLHTIPPFEDPKDEEEDEE